MLPTSEVSLEVKVSAWVKKMEGGEVGTTTILGSMMGALYWTGSLNLLTGWSSAAREVLVSCLILSLVHQAIWNDVYESLIYSLSSSQ